MFEFFAYIVLPLVMAGMFGWGAYLMAKGAGLGGDTSIRPPKPAAPPDVPLPRRYSRYMWGRR